MGSLPPAPTHRDWRGGPDSKQWPLRDEGRFRKWEDRTPLPVPQGCEVPPFGGSPVKKTAQSPKGPTSHLPHPFSPQPEGPPICVRIAFPPRRRFGTELFQGLVGAPISVQSPLKHPHPRTPTKTFPLVSPQEGLVRRDRGPVRPPPVPSQFGTRLPLFFPSVSVGKKPALTSGVLNFTPFGSCGFSQFEGTHSLKDPREPPEKTKKNRLKDPPHTMNFQFAHATLGTESGFMVQTGDPTGTGKGGQSIWGKKFEDEVRDDLKSVTLHTELGDVKIELFVSSVQRLV
ncbi:Peptidyl-prolyl cis-trans isomerase-like 3 [Chionoecetes opilio]|uniref:Peptidyl-prolyl cis-trans isomerase-like 3 n=1 Tax=Chionoecetes opilio TaxID=41210 RepID=A0A8J4YDP8_CHIOP|nr:Peptidyl-prolyl cis-trans isomerase-like 3 [Chionoecetes opilio]